MAEKSLLQIVNDFQKRVGLPVSPVAAAAQDDTTVQIVALMNEGIQDICDRYALQQLAVNTSFTHQNGANYLAWSFGTQTPDWKYNAPFTLWNNTTRLPVPGPASLPEWQRITIMKIAPAQYVYTLYGNGLYIYPVPTPPSTTTFSFFYQSKWGVVNPATGTGSETYDGDAYIPKLPTYLIEADLKWRWRKEKGLSYAEDMRTSESMLVNAVGRTPQPTLKLDAGEGNRSPGPGILIQPGSWPL